MAGAAQPYVQYVGPVSSVTPHRKTHWFQSSRKKIFTYLRSSISEVEPLLQALHQSEFEAKCVLPGASEALVKKYRTSLIEIFSEPVDIRSLLLEADIVIGYGGAALIAQGLLAATPQLLICDTAERFMNARRAEELGTAIILTGNRNTYQYTNALTALASNPGYKKSAKAFSAKYVDSHCSAEESIFQAIAPQLNRADPL